MTPKERAAMQQALECAERCESIDGMYSWADTITALREALAEQAEQEPAAKHWHDLYREKCQELHDERARLGAEIVALEQAEQEPVIGAYEVVNEKGDEWSLVYPAAVHRYKSIPEERITQTFYAAPVRTKDLTDDEIEMIFKSHIGKQYDDFARAVISADREKNK